MDEADPTGTRPRPVADSPRPPDRRTAALAALAALAAPFVCFVGYFPFAATGHPVAALVAVVALSFLTYGSVSHDLVHANLGLSPAANRRLLTALELIMLRSGTVYRVVHLNHHAKYPDPREDPEGAAAGFGLARTLWEGVIFQFKLGRWAWRRAAAADRRRMRAEWAGIELIALASAALLPVTPIPLAYCGLAYAGSWVIPLVTSYLVHRPGEDHVLRQTRPYRGRFYSLIAFEHLYHLEHHLYPQVPHQNWPRLARRLDPHFERAGIKPCRLS